MPTLTEFLIFFAIIVLRESCSKVIAKNYQNLKIPGELAAM